MSFEQIPGQERAKRMLRQNLRSGKVSHAYLFSGPAGTGRLRTALAFAQAILCERQGDDACGECRECRKVLHGNHPDLHRIAPDGATIKIDQIRDLQRQFSYRTSADQTKIYIIEQADKMTIQAANSLLKFLEEPNARIVAILIAENGQALLPTIQSRTQQIPFTTSDPERTAAALIAEGYPAELVRCAVRLAPGMESCRELIQSNGFAEMRNVMLQLGKECVTNRSSSVLLLVQQNAQKSEFSNQIVLLMEMFMLWIKDMISIQYNRTDNVVFADQLEWMTKSAFSRSASAWIRSLESAAEAVKRLRFNANPQLTLEQWLIGLQEG
jgi:DNA polymerase-3 subunit delta'